ncbi:hypothetical protein MBLNU230_g2561t1 [Neophaeotheca triangularis]
MATPATASNAFARIATIKSVDDCKALYDDWAQTYDADLTSDSQNYVAPVRVAQTVASANGNLDGLVLDAGCGTGLSGVALAQAGAKTIHGLDLSPAMLDVAGKTGVYSRLATADLSQPLHAAPDGVYDVVTCVGTLTTAHVGPVPALGEFVRVAKKGGLVVATVLDDVWASGGYEGEVLRLAAGDLAEIISTEIADYRKGAGVRARMIVLRKV